MPASASRLSSAARIPEDYSFMIGPDFPFAYSFSHQVSPGGELLAVATVNYRTYKIEIIMVSLKDGKVIKNITPGYKSTYDGIEFKFVPSDGRTFSWDRKGENIAFFVRKELDSYLIVMNALDNRVLKEFNIGAIQKASSPVFHPGTRSSCILPASKACNLSCSPWI